MSNVILGQKEGPPTTVELGKEPCEGRSSFRFKLDFSVGLVQQIDLTQFIQQGTIKSVQSIYVNNKSGANDLIFDFSGTQQSITVQAGRQAYISVLQPNAPVFTISCTNSAQIAFIQVLNFFMPTYMWGGTYTVDIPAIDVIIVNGRLNVRTTPQALVADTDRSGTITAGGTGQLLMATNASRLQWNLENPTAATEILQFSKISIAGPWYSLNAGGFASDGGSTIYTGSIWVLAATTGHAFTADEGQ